MLLLSNLSPQILDSENKQRDHSLSVSEAAQARGHSATRRPAAGRREPSIKGSETVADNQTRVREFTGVPNSSFCLVGSSSLALAVLILSTFIPPSLLTLKGDWSLFQRIQPSSGSGTMRTQGNAGSWTDFQRGKIASQLSDLSKGVL